ncbi:hypothetical protein TNCV_4400661 [Trichonephila clavipes]|nr:hypothetical protein TNCV_4400661 [Trichonephila clavipes]
MPDTFKTSPTSATFVFITNAQPDRFLSATDPVSSNHCTKSVIIDAFGTVSPGYFAEMHLSHSNEILQRNKIPRWLFYSWENIMHLRCAQLTTTDKYFEIDA